MTPDAMNLYIAGMFTDAEHERAKAWAAKKDGQQAMRDLTDLPLILHDNRDIYDPEGE